MELVDQIRAEILALSQTDNKIREQDLAAKFNVSRTSVRDALKQLQVEKLIDRKRNKGITLHQFTLKEIADIYDLRAALEGFAAHLVTEKISKQQLSTLKQLADEYAANELKTSDKAAAKRSELDDQFHQMIVDIADNSYLRDIMQQFSILKQAFTLYLKKDDSIKEIRHTSYTHTKIVEAIQDGDGALAEQLLRKHSLWAKKQLIARHTGIQFDSM